MAPSHQAKTEDAKIKVCFPIDLDIMAKQNRALWGIRF